MLSASLSQRTQEGNRSFCLGTTPETALQRLVEADSPAGLTAGIAPPTQGAGCQGEKKEGFKFDLKIQ